MDRTLINLFSILIAGAGLFAVLTGFNVPQASSSFYGDNPFAIKRDAIKETSDWVFTSVAVLGLLVQLCAEIWGDELPHRLHSTPFYVAVASLGLLAVILLVLILAALGRRVARRKWIPRVIGPQRDIFGQAEFIVRHNGIRSDQLPHMAEYSEAQLAELREANMRQANQYLRQLERLFDVRPATTLTERVDRLDKRLPARSLAIEQANE